MIISRSGMIHRITDANPESTYCGRTIIGDLVHESEIATNWLNSICSQCRPYLYWEIPSKILICKSCAKVVDPFVEHVHVSLTSRK